MLVFGFGVVFVLGIQYLQSQYSPQKVEKPPRPHVQQVLDRYVYSNQVNFAGQTKPYGVSLNQLNVPDDLVKAIAATPTVTNLKLEYCLLHEGQLKAMADALELRTLKIIGCRVSDEDVSTLINEPLNVLILQDVDLAHEDVIKLAGISTIKYCSAIDMALNEDELKRVLRLNPGINMESQMLHIVQGHIGTPEELAKLLGSQSSNHSLGGR
jgi:hypothetical protein